MPRQTNPCAKTAPYGNMFCLAFKSAASKSHYECDFQTDWLQITTGGRDKRENWCGMISYITKGKYDHKNRSNENCSSAVRI